MAVRMRIVNFSHPLTAENLAEVEALVGTAVSEVIEVPSQVDPQQPLEPQVESWLEGLNLTPRQWQTELLLFNLPALSYSAVVLVAQLHGRMGYFPPVLRLRPRGGTVAARFEVAEILNLQAIRERARLKRADFGR
ncbi:MAG: CRISPR-associated protein Csx15 [Moorellales bacterium]